MDKAAIRNKIRTMHEAGIVLFFKEFSTNVLSGIDEDFMDLYGKVPREDWKPQLDALVELPESRLEVTLPAQLSVTFVRTLLECWLDHPDLSSLVMTAINQFQDEILGMPESINAELALSMLILSAVSDVEINYEGEVVRKRGEVEGLVPAVLPGVREVVEG